MDYQHNPFVLIARITVKEGKVGEYMAIANDADNAVKKSEPGMLLHTFDADPNDKHKYVSVSYTHLTLPTILLV